jgi:hypothetical protein
MAAIFASAVQLVGGLYLGKKAKEIFWDEPQYEANVLKVSFLCRVVPAVSCRIMSLTLAHDQGFQQLTRRLACLLLLLGCCSAVLLLIASADDSGVRSTSSYVWSGFLVALGCLALNKRLAVVSGTLLVAIAYLVHEFALPLVISGAVLILVAAFLSSLPSVLYMYSLLRVAALVVLPALALLKVAHMAEIHIPLLTLGLAIVSSPSISEATGRVFTTISVVALHLAASYFLYPSGEAMMSLVFVAQCTLLALHLFFPLYATSTRMSVSARNLARNSNIKREAERAAADAKAPEPSWFGRAWNILGTAAQAVANMVGVDNTLVVLPALPFVVMLASSRLVLPVLAAFASVQRPERWQLGGGIAIAVVWMVIECALLWRHRPLLSGAKPDDRAFRLMRFLVGIDLPPQDPPVVKLALTSSADSIDVEVEVERGDPDPESDHIALYNLFTPTAAGQLAFSEPIGRVPIKTDRLYSVRFAVPQQEGGAEQLGGFVARYEMELPTSVPQFSVPLFRGERYSLRVAEHHDAGDRLWVLSGQLPPGGSVRRYCVGAPTEVVSKTILKEHELEFRRPWSNKQYYFKLFMAGSKYCSWVSPNVYAGSRGNGPLYRLTVDESTSARTWLVTVEGDPVSEGVLRMVAEGVGGATVDSDGPQAAFMKPLDGKEYRFLFLQKNWVPLTSPTVLARSPRTYQALARPKMTAAEVEVEGSLKWRVELENGPPLSPEARLSLCDQGGRKLGQPSPLKDRSALLPWLPGHHVTLYEAGTLFDGQELAASPPLMIDVAGIDGKAVAVPASASVADVLDKLLAPANSPLLPPVDDKPRDVLPAAGGLVGKVCNVEIKVLQLFLKTLFSFLFHSVIQVLWFAFHCFRFGGTPFFCYAPKLS